MALVGELDVSPTAGLWDASGPIDGPPPPLPPPLPPYCNGDAPGSAGTGVDRDGIAVAATTTAGDTKGMTTEGVAYVTKLPETPVLPEGRTPLFCGAKKVLGETGGISNCMGAVEEPAVFASGA